MFSFAARTEISTSPSPREAAPLIAYGTDNVWTFVSKRVGCKVLGPELDLAAVCLKR
jgi:hypothetical protein